MKTLVVYSSQSGNTRKLADAVFAAIDAEKEIYPVDEAPDPSGYNPVAVGFWFKAGKPDPLSLEFLSKIKGQNLFFFATHGAAAGSAHAEDAMSHARSLVPEAKVLGTFSCQGEVNPEILERVSKKPEPPVWLKDAPHAVGHPNRNDIQELKKELENIRKKFGW
ncbi:MAG: flavodoxin family protein [Desulfobacterales bacterium]|jgi:flavodoxin